MNNKRVYLKDENKNVYLDTYIADGVDRDNSKKKAILIIPGGGYTHVAADREGEAVALAFIAYGFQAFVLNYSVKREAVFPEQLIEASLAIKHIKDNAEEYKIDPMSVFVMGFSAGGHLAASLGTLWHIPQIYNAIDMPFGYNKPTGILPIYPVITGDESCSHKDSFRNLFGTDNPTEEQLKQGSLELHVDERTSPAFLMHTSNDNAVPVENSLRFATALARNGLSFELHIYPKGPHGIALANKVTSVGNKINEDEEIAKWVQSAVKWMERIADGTEKNSGETAE